MDRRTFLSVSAGAGLVSQAQAQSKLQIFLLAGQSNMAGRGIVQAQDKEPIAGVMALNKEMQWQPAVDPLHWDRPEIAGVGMGRSFGKAIRAAHPEMEIGLVPGAFGGSALHEWVPGSMHYKNAVERTRAALQRGVLRGILWHQGEADSADLDKARSYLTRWVPMMTSLKKDLNAEDVPVIVGQLGQFFVRSPYARIVNEQLAMIPATVQNTAFVPSHGLKHKGDDVHFDAPSLYEFGRRYAHAWLIFDKTS